MPPAEFVAERNRIARALKQAGRREEAKSIEKLTRPTVSVWATNQLARREPGLVKELGGLTGRLRGTQAGGAAAGEEGGTYGEVAAAHRALLGTLRAKAEEILTGGNHTATPQLLARIVANLRAGAADAERHARLEAGRLERDFEESGFESLLEGGAAFEPRPRAVARAPASGPAPTKLPRADPDARRRAEEAAASARQQSQARAEARAAGQRRVTQLRAAVTAAGHAVARAERAATAARAAQIEAERVLEEARGEQAELGRKLAAAEDDLRAGET